MSLLDSIRWVVLRNQTKLSVHLLHLCGLLGSQVRQVLMMGSFTRRRLVRTIGLVGFGAIAGVVASFGVLVLLDHQRSLESAGTRSNGDFNRSGSLKGPDQVNLDESHIRIDSDPYVLNALAHFTGDFAGTLDLHQLLSKSDQDQLSELLNQAREIRSPNRRHAVERSIVQRMAARDPKMALAQLAENPRLRHGELVATVFGEWSISNLDSAVAHAAILDDSQKFAALKGILRSRDDLSLDTQRQVARELGNEQFVDELQDESIVSSHSESPIQAWDILLNDKRDDLVQLPSLIRVAKQLVREHGMASLDELSDSLDDSSASELIARSAVLEIVQNSPQLAYQQAMKLSKNTREMVLPTIAEVWGRIDPIAALDSLTSLQSISLRTKLQESVLSAWAGEDPESVFEDLELLPDGLRKKAEDQAMRAIARSNPEDAVDLLANLTDPDRRRSLAMEIALNWSRIDVREALNWAGSGQFSDPELQWEVLSIVLRELAQHDLELAMQTELNQPLPRSGEGLESIVIDEMVNTDIDKAIEMLSEVRDGRTKFLAFTSTAKALVHIGEFDRAIELHEQLPESRQSNYFSVLFGEWTNTDPASLVAMLDELPSEQLKKNAATQLFVSPPFSPRAKRLSREQAQKVRKILWPSSEQNGA